MRAGGLRIDGMRGPRGARLLHLIGSRNSAFGLVPAASPLRRALFVAASCVVVVLAGCKTLPPAPPESAPWDVRKAALQARDQFDLKGRIAVAVAQEGFNAKLRWQQRGKQSNLALDGPLGVGGVRITSNGDSLKVLNAHGQQLDSEAAKQEINSKLGFEPPIASLRYWVLGVPDPATTSEEVLDDSKRLATLKQDGWQIDYTAYANVRGQSLPSKATLTREDVRVRLFVDDWGS
jgi:outer membrane lipoprotein LolB